MTEPKVRIFVSSPSDLEHERALVKDVIATLAQEYLPYFRLQAILWEEEALTAAQSFQAGLLRPSECEIVLVMLWTRLGTPLADDPYGGMTGTEWEFVDAVQASVLAGTPEVLVYKKSAPRLVDVNNAEATREALADRQRLDDFFRAHFFNPDGSFSRAFRQFGNDRTFRELLETQLRKLLNRRISAERRFASAGGDWHGSPFRADAPFDLVDDRVFTGRETETRELVTRLEGLQGAGQGLLLISGPSGVGKTSLIRAGLLPRLIRPFLFPGVAGCRWCLVGLDDRNPIESLATALIAPGMLGPALDAFGLDVDRLSRLLANEPDVVADQIQAALTWIADNPASRGDASNGRLQLAIIVDPLDRLLQPAMRGSEQARVLTRALARLAVRDGVWVIVSLRGDYLHHLDATPDLASLLNDQTWFRLEPPPASRIRQVIEIPARVAGIEYEGMDGGAGRGLVEALESEASLLEHWPAVLEPALHAIYLSAEQDSTNADGTAHRRLRIRDYRHVGGLSGTLLHQADRLWQGMDPALRDALPVLCRALIALEGGAAPLSGRTGDLETLGRNPVAASLLDALIEARLVVAEGVADPSARLPCTQAARQLRGDLLRLVTQTGEGWRARLRNRSSPAALEVMVASSPDSPANADADPDQAAALPWKDFSPIARFIHPALFEQWQPVRAWLSDPRNRGDLILRYQISRQARLWKRTDCNREYLLGEAGYAAAFGFAQRYGEELEPLELQLLDQSHQFLVYQRRRNRWARLLGLTLATLLVFATTAAFWAWDASREATLNLQRSLLKAADSAVQQGNTPEAVRLALNAGPYLTEAATDTLSRAFTTNRLIAMVQSEVAAGDDPLPPAFRSDGERLVTQSQGEGARIWALQGQRFQPEGILFGPQTPIHSVRFVGRGEPQRIIGIGEAGVWRLPAEPGQAPHWSCGARPDSPIALDPTGQFLALSHGAPQDRFAVCLLDLSHLGEPLWDLSLHAGELRSLAFAPDGELLVTASRDGSARVLETRTGIERVSLPTSGTLSRPANDARFDPAGRRIAVASADERIRVYGLDGQELAELGVVERDGRQVRIHKSAVRESVFSPGGQYLIAGDDAGQVVRWDLQRGSAEVLGHHGLSVEHVRVSPGIEGADHEPLVLSASLDKTARLWGLLTGKEIAVFSHDAAVSDARFSHDGQRVLTYSDLDGSARLWSISPTETLAFNLPSADHVWHLAMAEAPRSADDAGEDPQSVLLATAAFDGRVEVWQYDRRTDHLPPMRIWSLSGHQGRVRRVAFSPDVQSLASAGHDGTAWVWNLQTGGGCRLPLTADGAPCRPDGGRTCPNVHQALFAPDGRWLLTTSSDPNRPVRLWDPLACAPLAKAPQWGGATSGAQAAAISASADGSTWVAVGDDDGAVRVMRTQTGEHWTDVCAGQWHTDVVTDAAFSPLGGWFATASEDGSAALVEITANGCGSPRLLEPQAGALYSVAFARDGQALVTSALNAKAQVWDLHGNLIAELVGHKDRIYAAKFSPDGRWILTASRDGTIRIWSRPIRAVTEPLESFLILAGDLGGAAYADFSPDGHSIGVAYWENAALLWRLWTEDRIPNRRLESIWGPDRARLALIREAIRFKDENRLDRQSPE